MRSFLVTVLALAVGSGVGWYINKPPSEPTFHLLKIADKAGAISCAKQGGYAAQIAMLNEEGQVDSEWAAACLVEVK